MPPPPFFWCPISHNWRINGDMMRHTTSNPPPTPLSPVPPPSDGPCSYKSTQRVPYAPCSLPTRSYARKLSKTASSTSYRSKERFRFPRVQHAAVTIALDRRNSCFFSGLQALNNCSTNQTYVRPIFGDHFACLARHCRPGEA